MALDYDKCCEQLEPRERASFTFYQDTGRFVGGNEEVQIETFGYSGNKEGRNNPDMQCVSNVGVLPANTYTLDPCKNYMHNPPQLRPCSFPLVPKFEERMCGRFAMVIHGCQVTTPGDLTTPPAPGCSEGCIIINLQNRFKLRTNDVVVVKHYDPQGPNAHKTSSPKF